MDFLGFKFIYALIVMSMMKPAEKFLRGLFGMDKGKIANTATFESGKQLMDATAKFVKDAATVIATVATGGTAALFSQKGVESLMNLKGGADGFTNSLSSGVADAGAKDGFFSEQIKELSKKGTEDRIENMTTGKNSKTPIEAIKKDLIASGKFGTSEDELRAAEEAAKSKWKSLVTKYAPYGYTDYDTLIEFDKISKETGITKPEKVIAEYRKVSFAREQNKTREEEISARLAKDLESKIINNNGSYIIVANDGKQIEITYDMLLAGVADPIIKQKTKYIIEHRDYEIKDWNILNEKARNNQAIFNKLKFGLEELMKNGGGTYEITKENGDKLKVNNINKDSDEVKEAIMSKFKYINGIDDINVTLNGKIIKGLNFNELDRLDSTSASLNNNGVTENIDVKDFNDLIEEYRKKSPEDRYTDSLKDMRLNAKTRKVLAIEINARNNLDSKAKNNEDIFKKLKSELEDKVNKGGSYEITFNNNVKYAVDSGNLGSKEVVDAIMSKLKYIDSMDDTSFTLSEDAIKKLNFDDLNRLDRTRARLEKNTGKVIDVASVKKFDTSINDFIKSSKNRQNNILKGLDEGLKKALLDEVKVRNK